MKTLIVGKNGTASVVSARGGGARDLRHGPFSVCGRGAFGEASEQLVTPSSTGHTV